MENKLTTTSLRKDARKKIIYTIGPGDPNSKTLIMY